MSDSDCTGVVWLVAAMAVIFLLVLLVRFLSRCDICGKRGGTKYMFIYEDGSSSRRAHDGCLAEIQKNPHNFSDDAVENADMIFGLLKNKEKRRDSAAKESEAARKRFAGYESFVHHKRR